VAVVSSAETKSHVQYSSTRPLIHTSPLKLLKNCTLCRAKPGTKHPLISLMLNRNKTLFPIAKFLYLYLYSYIYKIYIIFTLWYTIFKPYTIVIKLSLSITSVKVDILMLKHWIFARRCRILYAKNCTVYSVKYWKNNIITYSQIKINRPLYTYMACMLTRGLYFLFILYI
jgi:hypothetical protein